MSPTAEAWLASILSIVVPTAILYVLLAWIGLAPNPFSPYCMTQIHQKIPGFSGFDFEISETNCDIIAKDDLVNVYISKHGQRQKVKLFTYDPVYEDFLPTITLVDERRIRISVRKVGHLVFLRESWEGLAVEYDIGIVFDPLEVTGPPIRIP